MTAITAAELQTGASALADVYAALAANLASFPKDQAVVLDALTIAAMLDPALAPLVVAEPIAEALLAFIAANNTQGRPGSQTPMHGSGARGSTGSGGGEIA